MFGFLRHNRLLYSIRPSLKTNQPELPHNMHEIIKVTHFENNNFHIFTGKSKVVENGEDITKNLYCRTYILK